MPQVRDTNQRRDATAAFPFMCQHRGRGRGKAVGEGVESEIELGGGGLGAVGNCGGVASLSAAVGVAWQAAPKMLQHNSQHVAQFCHRCCRRRRCLPQSLRGSGALPATQSEGLPRHTRIHFNAHQHRQLN